MERGYSVAGGDGVYCDRGDLLTRRFPKTAGEAEDSTDRRRAKQMQSASAQAGGCINMTPCSSKATRLVHPSTS
jgi:hypothetical protein